MRPLRILLAALVAAPLVAGAAFGSLERSHGAASCRGDEGNVLGYIVSAGHSCRSTIIVGQNLFRHETLHTGSPGSFTFRTAHLNKCIEFASSKDAILPTPAVAIKHLEGKTWCRHLKTDHGKTISTVGATIKTHGTIFGLDATSGGSMIKVSNGSVVASSTATKTSVTVRQGFQTFVPVDGPPETPGPISPDVEDEQALLFLRLDVTPLGPFQAAEHLRFHHERGAVVVGQASADAAVERKTLSRFKTVAVTSDELQSKPSIIGSRLKQVGARTVVVVGEFGAMESTLKLVRAKVSSHTFVLFVAA